MCANLTDKRGSYDFQQFQREISRLHELIPNIYNISLMGGEPFMNPLLCEFTEYARGVYPYAHITITTNGILLLSRSEEFYRRIRDAKAKIKLSLYPPFYERLDEWVALLKKYELKFFIQPVKDFGKCLSKVPRPVHECRYFCKEVRDGRISRCVPAFYAFELNKKFNLHLPEYEGMDLFDQTLTGEILAQKLKEPVELCKYCFLDENITASYPWMRSVGDDAEEDYFIVR